MTEYTPGPWEAIARTNAHIEIEAPYQSGYSAKKVATCSITNCKANARLIASAPELLEALNEAVADLDVAGFTGTASMCRSVIAKATGDVK